MQEQVLEIEQKDFEPKHIFECGQCFRWDLEDDLSYTGVFQNNVLNIKKDNDKIIFKGICNGNINNICSSYFKLDVNYGNIKQKLAIKDETLKESIQYGYGIRILNQDLWETIISFIISANNNIPRIKKIIEKLSQTYGNKIVWKDKEYYTFPTPEQLSKASVEDLRKLGLGFRDKRVYETTKKIINKEVILENLAKIKDENLLRQELMRLDGVGEKVADCIMLFSTLNRTEVFPVDVWVRRVMNDLYIKSDDENKISKAEIRKLARDKFGDLAGIAQQYLFYWRREKRI